MQMNRQSSLQMNYKQQQGVTLVIGLALLLVLALISHSSAEIGLNNEKVAHNTKLILEAEQAALSANQQAFETTNYINEALRYIDEPQFDDRWRSSSVLGIRGFVDDDFLQPSCQGAILLDVLELVERR